MTVRITAATRANDGGDVLALTEAASVTVSAGAASSALDGGLYRLMAVGADFLVKAGPAVTNGADGIRLTDGQAEVFFVQDGNKIGVSAV
jgi:hypothetical protein